MPANINAQNDRDARIDHERLHWIRPWRRAMSGFNTFAVQQVKPIQIYACSCIAASPVLCQFLISAQKELDLV